MTVRISAALLAGALLTLVLLAGSLQSAHAQSTSVQECVEQNLVRYTEPGTSAEAQYVDVEAACNDAVEETDSISVAPQRAPAAKSSPNKPSKAAQPSPSQPQTPVSPAPSQTTPSGSPAPSQTTPSGGTPSPEPTRTEPQAANPPPGGGGPNGGDTASVGEQLVIEAPPTSASSPGPFSGLPVWMVGLLIATVLLILGATLLQLRRSRA